ncbi:MAG: NUDIX domain-containing protein, partial [Acidobacteriota bacterium]
VLEETGARIRDIRFLATVKHAYTRFRVTLHVYRCQLGGRTPETGPERRWVSLRYVRRYPLPSASVRIVEILAGGEADGSGR